MKFVRRWATIAVLLPLVVAGCSDDPQPKFSPPSETASPTETSEPPEPEAWEVKSKKGAVAFAEHWVEAFNEAGQTGQTRQLTQLSSNACQSCSGFVEMLEELYREGGHLESSGWRIRQAVVTGWPPTVEARVVLRVQRSAQKVHDGNGDVQSFPSSKATYSAAMTWDADRWQMKELVLET